MNITILNGISDSKYISYEKALEQLMEDYSQLHHFVHYRLRDMNISFCCGCWSCWLKTPGLCVQKDEMPRIIQSVVYSDLLIFLSPLSAGFITTQLKKVFDKMVPLLHPHLTYTDGEMHHIARYEKSPYFALALVDDGNIKSFDIENTANIVRKMSLDMQTQIVFSIKTGINMEELKHELNNIKLFSQG